jgi:hypothetical protein
MQRAMRKLETYDRTYRPLVARLSETEFRSLYFAVVGEMTKRWPVNDGEEIQAYLERIKPRWIEKLIEESVS